ncbi:RNA methyltransferase [Ascidiaceihabitans sp.]|uniref:RNA methyltransferase n=1 Tax=Ascidiaceihabitans sp. TaxID=1872644 RepID=UPI0032971E92
MVDHPYIVLVRPQMGQNIGAAARAMLNFGLTRMRIVDPRDGWPNQSAVAMASGAGRVLDDAQIAPDVAGALGDCAFVFATTARSRDLTKDVYSPEEAMRLAVQKIDAGQKVAVMFGPERAGLENDDLVQANALISVPVNPDYASLNLAQCVLLVGYEWMRQRSQVTPVVHEMAGSDWAEIKEVDHLMRHYEDRLEDAGFFWPEHKSASMKLNLRNMWSRMPMTRADVQMFHGILRQMVRWKERDR